MKDFRKTVGASCHCIRVLCDAVYPVSQTAIFNNPQRRALRGRSGHAVAHSRFAHRVLKETSLTAESGTLFSARNPSLLCLQFKGRGLTCFHRKKEFLRATRPTSKSRLIRVTRSIRLCEDGARTPCSRVILDAARPSFCLATWICFNLLRTGPF